MATRRGRPSRATVYVQFATAAQDLASYGGLPSPEAASAIWDDIWHLEAHNSTALEGNTLVLREVEVLLEQGRAVGAKELKDYLEVTGYAAAARWVYQQGREPGDWTTGQLVSVAEVRRIHTEAMSPVWEVAPHPHATPREGPGSFREHDIHPFPDGMTPPAWPMVAAELSGWVGAANELQTQVRDGLVATGHLPERLASLHAAFERVHPFLDGNGRTGRLVLNLMLVRLGFPPAIVFKRERERYLYALRRADGGDAGPLGELLARAVIDNVQRFLAPHLAGSAQLAPLRSLASADLSYDALRQAARRGRLEAELGSDGIWRSSQDAVTAYLARRHRRDDRNRRPRQGTVALLSPLHEEGVLERMRAAGELEPATHDAAELSPPVVLPTGSEPPSRVLARLRLDER